jgi:adenine-specific DNA-methyltransferase
MLNLERLPQELVGFARKLRHEVSDAENLLWKLVRGRRLGGFKFTRQKPFPPYVVDFYCSERRLAIEVDGGQHAEPEQRTKDEYRTEILSKAGIHVLRFWNDQVLCETESVIYAIWNGLHTDRSRPHPLVPACTGVSQTDGGLNKMRKRTSGGG